MIMIESHAQTGLVLVVVASNLAIYQAPPPTMSPEIRKIGALLETIDSPPYANILPYLIYACQDI